MFKRNQPPPASKKHDYVASKLFARRHETEDMPFAEGMVCAICGNLQDTHKR